jgi:hypothetical protein
MILGCIDAKTNVNDVIELMLIALIISQNKLKDLRISSFLAYKDFEMLTCNLKIMFLFLELLRMISLSS